MNWWNRYKKSLAIFLISIIGIALVAFVVLLLIGPIIGNTFCTMVGVLGEGLTVYVDNAPHPLRSYEIILDYPFPTPSDKIICDESSLTTDSPDFSPLGVYCISGGAFFPQNSGEPPKSISITVVIEGRSVEHKYKPSYHLEYPNGQQCGPSYFATIHFDFSQK